MSGILNTGKINTLLARLTSTWAAKLDTLHDTRITAARAANLDNLDAPVSAGAGGKRRAVKLTAASGSWTHPANIKDNFVLVTLVAGGGAGGRGPTGSGGAGGGGGEVVLRAPYVLEGAGSEAYTVAASVAGRSTDGTGANGGDTTFGSLTASGGEGGTQTNSHPPGGGSAVAGWRIKGGNGRGGGALGGDGSPGISAGGVGSDANDIGGGGGSWGEGGPAVSGGGSGADGVNGGGGGGCNTGTSGAGGGGFILLEYEEGS